MGVAVVVIAAATFAWIRWQDHAKRVERLQVAAQTATHLAATYKVLIVRVEAKRVLGNQLLDRFTSAQERARGEPIGGVATVRDRLESLRRGDRFDDVAAYARGNLPSSEMQSLDSDFTILLKRQEDASDATEIITSTFQQLLANPWARLGFTDAERDKMWKGFDDARTAYNKAFEKMQVDVYDRAGAAIRHSSMASVALAAARRESPFQAAMAP